jgi:nucleoside phosphorylase
MILVYGSTHDDILYFEMKMRNKSVAKLPNGVIVTIGEIYGQQVLLMSDIYTNYLTSAIVAYLIEKYSIFLVINVGLCVAFTDDLKTGDIAIAQSTYLGDIDTSVFFNTKLGQAKNMPEFYISDVFLMKLFSTTSEKLALADSHVVTLVSSNKMYQSHNDMRAISIDGTIFGKKDNVILDTEGGGGAVASYLFNIPFISVKVVLTDVDRAPSQDDYLKALRKFVEVGKLISSVIGEVGRNDTTTVPDSHA